MDQQQQAASGQTNPDPAAAAVENQAAPTDNQTPAAEPAGNTLLSDGQPGAAADKPAGDAAVDGDGGKPADEAAAEVVYDFKMPEGMELDAEIGAELIEFAKEKKLSADEAQKLVDLGTKMREKEAAAYQIEQTKWVEQIKADPEMGGAQLDANVAVAKQALDAFGTPELKGLLNTTGFGNHPEVVRAFYKIGKAISEDRLVVGQGKPKGVPADPAKRMFPNQT